MTSDGGRLQDPSDFAVEIRSSDHRKVWGTGFIVSPSGLVATCRHVVRDAAKAFAPGTEVGVYFRRSREGRPNACQARVCAVLPEPEDDLILLQLAGDLSLSEYEVAVLGQAQTSQGNRFRSFGFPDLGTQTSSFADGKIMGSIPPPENVRLKADPVQLRSKEIHQGMSGAPVLDLKRNLVVAVLAKAWLPDEAGRGQGTGWGVDAQVLGLPPFGLALRDDPLPHRPARQPQPGLALPAEGPLEDQLHGALPLLSHWIGREELLAAVAADFASPAVRVVGLIGFGGTGKSSLARRWVDDVTRGPAPPAVFWWSFNVQPSVDAFLEAALRFVTAGRIDPGRLPGAGARVQVIAAGLGTAPLLFVLDGLDSVQSLTGDNQGELLSSDLRELIELFAESSHSSFCLITSRLPMIDLIAHSTYREHDVGALTVTEGRNLLRKLGVRGTEEEVNRLVETWGGHALTLELLGSLLVETASGEASRAADLSLPALGESRYQVLQRLLESYDAHLGQAERIFLGIFSLFRRPVAATAFSRVFRASGSPRGSGKAESKPHKPEPIGALALLNALSPAAVERLADGLTRKRLLQRDETAGSYSMHPLVRSYYGEVIKEAKDLESLHRLIAAHYIAEVTPPSDPPLLEELMPWMEALHHRALARRFDAALDILWQVLLPNQQFVMTRVLGAYEAMLAVLREFFAAGDLTRDCLIPPSINRRRVMREAAFTLMTLGRSRDALDLYERLVRTEPGSNAPKEASLTCQDLCRLKATLGQLAEAETTADACLDMVRRRSKIARKGVRADTRNALVLRGWIRQVRGNADGAASDFKAAVNVARVMAGSGPALDGSRGALYAEHLRHMGLVEQARALALQNLAESESRHHLLHQSRFHRILGMLDARTGALGPAREHLDAAVRLARGTSDRLTLLEALVSRSGVLLQAGDLVSARLDLDDAWARAVESGFRLLEIDARVLRARLHHAEGQPEAARAEAESARRVRVGGSR